jgi:hypothetical protein
MADRTEIQVTYEWLVADKSANQSNFVKKNLGMTVGAGIVLDTQRKLINYLCVDSLSH